MEEDLGKEWTLSRVEDFGEQRDGCAEGNVGGSQLLRA